MSNAKLNGTCDRAESLVTYLYGELSQAESAEFRTHAVRCPQCSAELVEFEGLHRSMADWRELTLGQFEQPAISPDAWMPERPVVAAPEPRRSWLAAIQELLTSTPRWAQAGLAMATLTVAALAVFYLVQTPGSDSLSTARSFESAPVRPIDIPKQEIVPTPREVVATTSTPRVTPRRSNSSNSNSDQMAGTNRRVKPGTLDRQGRQELASLTKDLLLLDGGDSDAPAPRLSDILSDGEMPSMEPNQ